jgi:hypothetical protein
MPIEIRELVIRATVQGGPPPGMDGSGSNGRAPAPLSSALYEQLLQECVRQVLQALARERER